MGGRRARQAQAQQMEDDALGGLRGSGSGAGGYGRAMAPPPVTPAPAPVSTAPAAPPVAANEALPPREFEKPAPRHTAAAKPKKPRQEGGPAVTIVSEKGLRDTASLVEQLRRLVAVQRRCLGSGELALMLTIDGSGKVTKVALVRGDAGALACLKGRVLGLMTGSRPVGGLPGIATVEVVIRL
jgi:hypothetical protein